MPGTRLYEDGDFPAAPSSLFRHRHSATAVVGGGRGGGGGAGAEFRRCLRAVEWRRPHELCDAPTLLPPPTTEEEEGGGLWAQARPVQGALGDCWLLSASVALLRNPRLLGAVFPPGQVLCPDGGWVEVEVDDRLPVLPLSPPLLCFARCPNPRLFWVSLLEKAFAKLYGCYEALGSGQVTDAVVNLTGGLAEKWYTRRYHNHHNHNHHNNHHNHHNHHNHQHQQQQQLPDHHRHHGDGITTAGADALGGFHAFSVLGTSETRGEKSLLLWNTLGTPGAGVEPGVEPGELRVGEADFPDLFDEVTLGYPIMPCGGGLVDILTGKPGDRRGGRTVPSPGGVGNGAESPA
ncbi:unnamed protein product [Lampetra fluviatilis]